MMPLFVPEEALDYEEILRRGGHNGGDEDFALFKCPSCQHIYLMDYEVETVFPDAADLLQRVAWSPSFVCLRCSQRFPEGPVLWNGSKPDPRSERFAVTWPHLLASEWKWIVKPEVVPARYRP